MKIHGVNDFPCNQRSAGYALNKEYMEWRMAAHSIKNRRAS